MASAKHGAELLVLKKKLMPRKEGSPDVYRDRASLGNKTAITLTATRMHERVECCGKEASDAALETSCASRFPGADLNRLNKSLTAHPWKPPDLICAFSSTLTPVQGFVTATVARPEFGG